MTLYTYGYEKQTPEDLLALAESLDAKVIDVRYKPYSKDQRWVGDRLAVFLGKHYWHCKDLGNLDYKSASSIRLVDEKAGLEFLSRGVEKGRVIILLCMENSPKGCHRDYISKKMMEMFPELEVEHIMPNGKRIHEQRSLL